MTQHQNDTTPPVHQQRGEEKDVQDQAMSRTPNNRCKNQAAYNLKTALNSIPVRSHDFSKGAEVPLDDIQIVRPSHSGLLDVVYTSVRRLPSGITVHEIKSGESTIDQLLIALGWQAGMSHNEHVAKLTDFRFET